MGFYVKRMRSQMVRMVDLVKNKGDEGALPRKGTSLSSSNRTSDTVSVSFVAARSSEQFSKGTQERRSMLKGGGGGAKSLSTPTSLGAKSKYCPFLGGRKNRKKIIDYPPVANVCYGEESREKKLLRTITLPFSVIPAQRQRELCQATYRRCPIFKDDESTDS